MPRVFDRDGRELTIGARVRHATEGLVGYVAEFDFHRKKVRVKWESRSRLAVIGASMNYFGHRGIQSLSDSVHPHLTAPDLLLIDPPAEAKPQGGS